MYLNLTKKEENSIDFGVQISNDLFDSIRFRWQGEKRLRKNFIEMFFEPQSSNEGLIV